MNRRGSRFVKFNSTAVALLATVLLVSGGASAKDHKAKGSDSQARVVAHIPFTGLSAIDRAMQNRGNNRVYLYVQHSQFQGISIIDISKPAEAKALGLIPWPDPAKSSKMNVTGDLAIIAETGPSRCLAAPRMATLCFGTCRIRPLRESCKSSRESSNGFRTSEISFMS